MALPNIIYSDVPFAFIQQINAGKACSGVLPPGTPSVSAPGRVVYAPSDDGGLFDFGARDNLALIGMEFSMPGSTKWSVSITDGMTDIASNDVLLKGGDTVAPGYVETMHAVYLLPGQKIKVTGTGTIPAAGWRLTCKVAALSSGQGIWH